MAYIIPSYVATDGYDQLVWTLNDVASGNTSSGPWANTGAAGTLNMNTSSSTVTAGTGAYGNAVQFSHGGPWLKTSATSVGESTTNLTVSLWYYPNSFGSVFQTIFAKNYNNGSWSSPFASIWFLISNNAQATWSTSILIGGTNSGPGATTLLSLQHWNHLGISYDGTTIKTYHNGRKMGQTTTPGVINYNVHGEWLIGGAPSNNDTCNGIVDDIRVANTTRSDAWFQQFATGYNGSLKQKQNQVLMNGYDSGLGKRVFWYSYGPDPQGLQYTGTAANLSDVFEVKFQ